MLLNNSQLYKLWFCQFLVSSSLLHDFVVFSNVSIYTYAIESECYYLAVICNFTCFILFSRLTKQNLALYVISVRRTRDLPTASFRFHLTVDTLAVQLYTSLLPRRIRDFHPLERAHGAQTIKGTLDFSRIPLCRRPESNGVRLKKYCKKGDFKASDALVYKWSTFLVILNQNNIQCFPFIHRLC